MIAPLGAGGMGEVYRARDTRLGRSVAIKVLPESVSNSAEHRQRFEREARAIAALNHPNICTLHDVGRSGETDFLVMELVDGETLAARLQKGPLPPAEVLRIGVEIATALARAHRAGILHRDLKPGNVMLTKTGAKLMDFGLARLSIRHGGTPGATQLPTQTAPITGEGRIVGTFQYMAPEQLEGREADARSDIWALGATLYEMATGRRAFEGTSTASVIGAIMREEPRPITELAPMNPPGLDRLVRTCLAKDPDARWQGAADLARELEWLRHGTSSSERATGSRVEGHEVLRTTRGIAVGAAVVTVLILGVFTLAGRPPWRSQAEPRLTRTQIFLPGPELEAYPASAIALSPDGSVLAMTLPDNTGTWRLYVRPLDESEPHMLETPHGAKWPMWSPDSREIAFVTDEDKLVRMSSNGGPPQTICEVRGFEGGSWGARGRIVFSGESSAKVIQSVSASGGSPVSVTQLDSTRGESGHVIPSFLPDGEHFLYVVLSKEVFPNFRIRVGSISGDLEHDLLQAGGAPRVSRDGHIVYYRDRVLLAQGVDRRGSRLLGRPVPLPGGPERGGAELVVGRPRRCARGERHGFREFRRATNGVPLDRP